MSQQPSERLTLSLAEVSETYRRMRRIERAIAAHGLTTFQLVLLHSIALHPDAPLGNNAIQLGVTPAVISNGLDRLERRGLAERLGRGDESSPDRRQVRARVTDRGQTVLAALEEMEIEL